VTDNPEDNESAPGGNKADGVAKHHDNAVQHALVEAQKQILQFLRRRLGDRDAADEVLQRFSLRALERASQLHDVRMVRGWLGRILATTIVDHQREGARRRPARSSRPDQRLTTFRSDEELDAAICNCLYSHPADAQSGTPTSSGALDFSVSHETAWRPVWNVAEQRDGPTASRRQALRKRLEEMCRTCPVHGFLDCHSAKRLSSCGRRSPKPRPRPFLEAAS